MSTNEQLEPLRNEALDLAPVTSALATAGAAWARYGLVVGKTALEASARTLEATAAALGSLAERASETLAEGRRD